MSACEFMMRKLDRAKCVRSYEEPCGTKGARFVVHGALTSVKLTLCEYHRKFIETRYGWRLTPDATQE